MIDDQLFLMHNCPDCARIKSVLSRDAIYDDDFRGANSQMLNVFYAFSNNGTRVLLDNLGLHGQFTPVLVTHRGRVLDDWRRIVAYLKQQRMTED